MERLTSRDEKGNLNVDGKEVYAGYLYNAVALLEEYEDTGLTPEQIIHLKSRYLPFQDQACVGEILRWLAGEYVFDPDCLTD